MQEECQCPCRLGCLSPSISWCPPSAHHLPGILFLGGLGARPIYPTWLTPHPSLPCLAHTDVASSGRPVVPNTSWAIAKTGASALAPVTSVLMSSQARHPWCWHRPGGVQSSCFLFGAVVFIHPPARLLCLVRRGGRANWELSTSCGTPHQAPAPI